MTPEAGRESPAPRPRRVPAAFLTALVLFFLLDRLLWSSAAWLRLMDRYVPTWGGDALVTASIALLPRDEAQPPILIMGSSQTREGVDCSPFDARFPGRTCRNLSVNGGAPLDFLYLVHRIDQRTRRRVIVTSLFPRTFTRGPRNSFTNAGTLEALAASGTLTKMPLRDATAVLEAWLMNASETVRTKNALEGLWRSVRHSPAAAWSLALPASPRRMGDRFRREATDLDGELATKHRGLPISYLAVQERALDDIIEGERARGNLFVVVDFPTRPGYEEMVPDKHLQLYREWLEGLAARKGVLLVRHESLPAFPAEDWNDWVHLNDAGMAKMSARLVEIVARAEGR